MTLIIQKRYACRLMWVMGPERGLLIEDLKREIESIKKGTFENKVNLHNFLKLHVSY